MLKRPYIIETFKGEGVEPFYWRIVSTHNGQVILTSEGYASRWGRNRAVKRFRRSIFCLLGVRERKAGE